MCLSYKNHSIIDLHCKSMELFLYDRDLRHKRVNEKHGHVSELNKLTIVHQW